MNWQEFTALLILATAMSFTPGPNTILCTAFGSLLRDWLAGPVGSGKRLTWFNRAMAAVLVVTALWMLFL